MTQEEALTILKTGANAFLTGEPGSGKTHTINRYVAYLRLHGIEPAICAATGIAATHIGGMTIHSWSGIGIRNSLTEYDVDKISQNERTVRRIRRAHVLIIDEVSMLSAQTLDMVEALCRRVRGGEQAFGGLQVVLVGDFFQLPPIVRTAARDAHLSFGDTEEHGRTPFAYESSAWRLLKPFICYLSEQHRQEDDALLAILSALRNAEVNEDHVQMLASRNSAEGIPADITRLFSHNADVDRINDDRLAAVAGAAKRFAMQQQGAPALAAQLVRTCLSPQELTLKIGARVMFTKNDPQGAYVNGTTGTVALFRTDSYPIIETMSGARIAAEPAEWSVESEGRVLARVTQVPLRLAWAITVHKSQGMSLDAAVIDLSRAFEYGQGYVALSRVRTLSGLYLLGMNRRALEVHPQICEYDATLREQSDAAETAFLDMPEAEVSTLHRNFIRACGGSLEAAAPRKAKEKALPTIEQTHLLLTKHARIEDIAKARSFSIGTILSHLEKLQAAGTLSEEEADRLLAHIDPAQVASITAALHATGGERLRPAYDALGGEIPFETIRLVRLSLKKRR